MVHIAYDKDRIIRERQEKLRKMRARRLVLTAGIVCAAVLLAYAVARHYAKTNLELNSKFAVFEGAFTDAWDFVRGKAADTAAKIDKLTRKVVVGQKMSDLLKRDWVEITLKHGSTVSGELLFSGEDSYTIRTGDGEEFSVIKAQVKKMERKTRKQLVWPYKNDVVAQRINTVVMDGRITRADKSGVTVLFDEGVGSAEMEVPRKDMECLLFAPVCGEEDLETEMLLKEQFPNMKIYRNGNVTIFTDSIAPTVRKYEKVIRDFYTSLFLEFYGMLKGRAQKRQQFVVIFDNYWDYAEYAMTDGIPFRYVPGYFEPRDNVLYMANVLGEKIDALIYERIVGETGEKLHDVVASIKERVDDFHHIAIDGQAREIRNKYAEAYAFYKNELWSTTTTVLRHEMTHSIFHSWGIQNIPFGESTVDRKEVFRKKKDFMSSDDTGDRSRIIDDLIKMNETEMDEVEYGASQSWLGEGLATYCEPAPMGSVNAERLYDYQEMVREGASNPIEFLTAFKEGSFRGVKGKSAFYAYAESWALTDFLMKRHHDVFVSYIEKISFRAPDAEGDDLDLLLRMLGMGLESLEKEFKDYMSTYDTIDSPQVTMFMKWHNIWTN